MGASLCGGGEKEWEKVDEYPGFTEHAYRLLFQYGEKYVEEGGPWHLKTILPEGMVENDKSLKPGFEGGLICYAYPQTAEPDVAQNYLDSNFVWKRDDGTFAIVQTWPTKVNKKFTDDFKINSNNPSPGKFKPKAAEEFEQCMRKVFGDAAVDELGIKYCHKKTENKNKAYKGKSEDIYAMLCKNEKIVKEMDIAEVGGASTLPGSLSFVANWVNGKGEKGTKPFTMGSDTMYVLYIKQGWETMACVKPFDQFEAEADFYRPTGPDVEAGWLSQEGRLLSTRSSGYQELMTHEKAQFPPGCELPQWAMSKDAFDLCIDEKNVDTQVFLPFCSGPSCRRVLTCLGMLYLSVLVSCGIVFHFHEREIERPPFLLMFAPLPAALCLAWMELTSVKE